MAPGKPRVRAQIALVAIAVLACARYEPAPGYEALARQSPPPECFERAAAITAAPRPAAAAPAGAPAITGVVRDEGGRPVVGATVDLRADSAVLVHTDSVGRFAFAGVPPGQYRMRVRALGYNTLDVGIMRAEADPQEYRIVVPQRIFDGPCSAIVVVKKPWWKWW